LPVVRIVLPMASFLLKPTSFSVILVWLIDREPMSLTFMIVDDESLSRKYIRNLVCEFYTDPRILEAPSAKAAIPVLEEEDVDVLFLDIRMQGMDGFGLLESISHRNFEVVFVTAYSEYAIGAIKQQAFDYLLKPIRKSEFRETMQRVVDKCTEKLMVSDPIRREQQDYLKGKISINHLAGVKIISLGDILYLKAANTYTTIYLKDGEKFTASRPISRFEALLSAPWFFRIHKSYIVNMAQLKEYLSQEGHFAVMNNGDLLNISRYRITEFLGTVQIIAEKRTL
jgi:two-component system LytT family response regulator